MGCHILRLVCGWVILTGLAPVRASLGGNPQPPTDGDRAAAEQFLASKGLRQAGSAFVLPAEEDVRTRLAAMEKLVTENQAAIRRRIVRAGVSSDAHSWSLGLQAQRFTDRMLGATDFSRQGPVSGNPNILTPTEARSAALGEQLRLTDFQLQNVYNLNAGVLADMDADAADALLRLDKFDEGSRAVERTVRRMARAYEALGNDPQVRAALATLGHADAHRVLSPRDDYPARLKELAAAMQATHSIARARGNTPYGYSLAALVTESARREYRMALGRLDEWDRQARAATPSPANPSDRADIEHEISALREKYVRGARLLRQAYDALGTPPLLPAPPAPGPIEPGRIAALIEQQRAGIRASFVADVEKSLRVARVPLEREGDALWVRAAINGVADLRLRVDLPADLVVISERFATTFGLRPGGSIPQESVTTPEGLPARECRTRLDSVQVGPFTTSRVGALIVSGNDVAPVLGRSAFGPLVVRLDDTANSPTMTLTQVDLPPIAPRPLPIGAIPLRIRNRPATARTP